MPPRKPTRALVICVIVLAAPLLWGVQYREDSLLIVLLVVLGGAWDLF